MTRAPTFTNLVVHRRVSVKDGSEETGSVDTFGDIGGLRRIQRGWLTDEQLIQFKLCPGAISLYKKKHAGHRVWVKLSPLVKEWHHQDSQDLSEDSVDIQDVRSRSGVWPIVEAAVRMSDPDLTLLRLFITVISELAPRHNTQERHEVHATNLM